jgi:DNA (cytosine-5)-methyltransferase 1
MGYARAGFEVVGVDIAPQPHYPFEFVQADMLEAAEELANSGCWLLPPGQRGQRRCVDLAEIDLVHVSAPCQRWSKQTRCRPELREKYPDLITPMRPLLEEMGKPYVMENVEGAPLRDPVMLCGTMFRRELYRHRLFETGNGVSLPQLPHPPHVKRASRAGHWEPGTVMSISGHIAPIAMARELMGIGWTTREELAEAVPVYFGEWVGLQVRSQLLAAA